MLMASSLQAQRKYGPTDHAPPAPGLHKQERQDDLTLTGQCLLVASWFKQCYSSKLCFERRWAMKYFEETQCPCMLRSKGTCLLNMFPNRPSYVAARSLCHLSLRNSLAWASASLLRAMLATMRLAIFAMFECFRFPHRISHNSYILSKIPLFIHYVFVICTINSTKNIVWCIILNRNWRSITSMESR